MKTRILALVFGAFLLSGCTIPTIAGKVAATVAKPVLGLAVKDAATTLAWVEREAASGRLSTSDAELAKQCPEAVLALDTLRAQLEAGAEDPEGFKGLIYYGTLERFSQGPQAEISLRLEQLASTCIRLIPADKLPLIF